MDDDIKKLRKAFKKHNVEFACQEAAGYLQAEIDLILAAVGIESAWVSDESMIGDFAVEESDLPALEDELGVKVSLDDYVIAVAQRMRS